MSRPRTRTTRVATRSNKQVSLCGVVNENYMRGSFATAAELEIDDQILADDLANIDAIDDMALKRQSHVSNG